MFLLIVMAIVLMVMDQRMSALSHVRAVLSMPLAPLQYVVSWPIE
jgi:cell shape-determining protein MreC